MAEIAGASTAQASLEADIALAASTLEDEGFPNSCGWPDEPWHGTCRQNDIGILQFPSRGWKAAVRASFKRTAFLLLKPNKQPVLT
ncbi:hypothetical protein BjapCC829_30140 [Bradyrhizobium barranii]|uniref:Uncharacterized protein n=1 Tax=Bradyrhizobium barranii TaxID=2992140 RepID=A0ABY3R1A7_9BRAD|nr:hypothetical protein [Bradyrhizobium japonicum]UFW91494.1 hypothetical protein BjapCC829_30140 [Bradyrhizobium japonicum]